MKKWVIAKLASSEIGKKTGRYYAVLWFVWEHTDGTREDLPRFLALDGDGLEITKQHLRLLGLQGNVSQICGQGSFNDSEVLRFGNSFEVQLTIDTKDKSKKTIDRIREIGEVTLRDAISTSEARTALEGVEV